MMIDQMLKRKRLGKEIGVPPLLRGIEFLQISTVFSSNFAVISVSINPGATTLHLIFLEPNSKGNRF